MNWLTVQLSQASSFGPLLDRSDGDLPSSLRVLRYGDLVEHFPEFRLPSAEIGAFEGSFLLVEDGEPAAARWEGAAERSPEDVPTQFTLALGDGAGTSVYLPEEQGDQLTLQCFTVREGDLGRVRAGVVPTANGIQIIAPPQVGVPGRCSDGPCRDWGAGCGSGCACHKFEVDARMSRPLFDALRVLLRAGGRTYALRCE